MVHRDIIVIGGSAGALEMLDKLVGGLREPFAAAVFIVLHVPPYSRSYLPGVLGRRAALPVVGLTPGYCRPGGDAEGFLFSNGCYADFPRKLS